jgi:two-component system, NtrC family, sensor kinase
MNLRHTPIRTKLRFVILTTCAVALLVACATLFAIQFYVFRKEYREDLASVAGMIANRVTAAINFDNPGRAEAILGSLAVKPYITSARLVLADGKPFAEYRPTATRFTDRAAPKQPEGLFEGENFIYAQPVELEGERLGTLYLISDYGTQASRLINLYLAIFCGVLALSVFVGLLVSARLAHFVTDPLQNLASTVRTIAGNNDYSVRAEKAAEDEVGAFTDSFNEMLERIQNRDGALRHEIAERARAEKELQVLHAQLVEASRQAGMAEVATGVLHNVGNVLNSVNVSATLVAEKLNVHRLNNLQRTAEMLREKNGQLGEFLATDPKGRLIPGYLADLSKHLVTERQDALVELELLTKNIEHIKEIVSMQQNYARVAGLTENVRPDALLDDALRMTTGSLQRHHIEVIRDYEDCAPVNVERHKVLQILVNLIRNAKHSLDEASPASKVLTIRVRKTDDGFVSIVIQDNGTGIPPENLTRIFSHGFTTRKGGHGFGLHSAALAAQQMQGRLAATSEGVGKGATFTLELPLARAEVSA